MVGSEIHVLWGKAVALGPIHPGEVLMTVAPTHNSVTDRKESGRHN